MQKGTIDIVDQYAGSAACTLKYRSFSAWEPTFDAVMFANNSARLTTKGMFRQSEDGKGYADIARPGSDLPRLPVSGPEQRLVEISLKPSQGDFGAIPDSGVDKFSAQLTYRSLWSNIPSAVERNGSLRG